MIEVDITNQQSAVTFDQRRLAAAAELVLREEGISRAVISLAVVDDAAIHELNRRHLAHDYPTDVLSFELSRDGGALEGEVIVSADTAARAAPRFGWTADDELLLYTIHGMLHLAGYDDGAPQQRLQMRKQETRYLARFGLTPRYDPEADD